MHVTDNRLWFMYFRFGGFATQMTIMNSLQSFFFLSHLFSTKITPLKPLSLSLRFDF